MSTADLLARNAIALAGEFRAPAAPRDGVSAGDLGAFCRAGEEGERNQPRTNRVGDPQDATPVQYGTMVEWPTPNQKQTPTC